MPTIRKKVTYRVCSKCGHPWRYKATTKDPRCTNPTCRSRKWNEVDEVPLTGNLEIDSENILEKLRNNLLNNLQNLLDKTKKE